MFSFYYSAIVKTFPEMQKVFAILKSFVDCVKSFQYNLKELSENMLHSEFGMKRMYWVIYHTGSGESHEQSVKNTRAEQKFQS